LENIDNNLAGYAHPRTAPAMPTATTLPLLGYESSPWHIKSRVWIVCIPPAWRSAAWVVVQPAACGRALMARLCTCCAMWSGWSAWRKCRPWTMTQAELWLQSAVCALCTWSSNAQGGSAREYRLALCSSLHSHGLPVTFAPLTLQVIFKYHTRLLGDPTGSPCPLNPCRPLPMITCIQQDSLTHIVMPSFKRDQCSRWPARASELRRHAATSRAILPSAAALPQTQSHPPCQCRVVPNPHMRLKLSVEAQKPRLWQRTVVENLDFGFGYCNNTRQRQSQLLLGLCSAMQYSKMLNS